MYLDTCDRSRLDPDEDECGCARSFSGVNSHKAAITAASQRLTSPELSSPSPSPPAGRCRLATEPRRCRPRQRRSHRHRRPAPRRHCRHPQPRRHPAGTRFAKLRRSCCADCRGTTAGRCKPFSAFDGTVALGANGITDATWGADKSRSSSYFFPPEGLFDVWSGDSLAARATELLNPATGLWTATGSMAAKRQLASAVVLTNGDVLVTGGIICCFESLVTTEIYHPATGTWTTVGSMALPRGQQPYVRLANGQVLIAGGDQHGIAHSTRTAEIFHPDTATWKLTSAMHHARR